MTLADKKELIRFGKSVRAQRQLLRFKQKEVAAMVGIDPRTMANIEWGRHWPSVPGYFRLCRALQMPGIPPFGTP